MSGQKAKNSPKKGYVRKDFDKEKMYEKIMPSTPALQPEIPPLYNYMEDILWEKLPGAIRFLNACGCERCRRDMIALALNQLPPAYLVTGEEGLERKLRFLRGQYDAQATAALIAAVRTVRERPRHGGE